MVNLATGLMGKSVCVRTCLSNFVRPKNWKASILEGANSPHEFESSQCGFKVRVIIMISVRHSFLMDRVDGWFSISFFVFCLDCIWNKPKFSYIWGAFGITKATSSMSDVRGSILLVTMLHRNNATPEHPDKTPKQWKERKFYLGEKKFQPNFPFFKIQYSWAYLPL